MYQNKIESESEVIDQLDGNITDLNLSTCSDISANPVRPIKTKKDMVSIAANLPSVASYNLRSLLPKIGNLTTDLLERSIDCAFLCEIWENCDNEQYQSEVEKLLQMHGLHYESATRKANHKGVSYGGVALVVNLSKFSCQKLPVNVPSSLEVVWCLLRPKSDTAKKIISCAFYSPPDKGKNVKLADHIVTTLHHLITQYPDAAIICGGDKNHMDIRPILGCGLKLKQIVDKPTRQGAILDIIIMNTFTFYNSPEIAPPIQPDDATSGKPSDHSVPTCFPHTNSGCRPRRNFKTIKYRPLPESRLRDFGQWITDVNWDDYLNDLTPTQQVVKFERFLDENLERFCPTKTVRLSSQDKPWITGELKHLARKKSREYVKRGKSDKYKEICKEFSEKYEIAAKKFIEDNVEMLMEAKPGQAYQTLKKLGAQPGDCTDGNDFLLEGHETLSAKESSEKIANYFSKISEEYPPLDFDLLPPRVQNKLTSDQLVIPKVEEYEAYMKILSSKKPKSLVPGDFPRTVVTEFAPELSYPVSKNINNIV